MVKASEGLIRILADASRDDKVFLKYGVNSMPTILFLDPDGKQVGELEARNAAAVKTQFEEIASKHGRGPKWLAAAAAALEAGKADAKPVALVFLDAKPKSDIFMKMLGAETIPKDLFEKVAFARIEFKKDSEDAKKWKVTEAPTMILLDGSGEEPKLLRTFKSGGPRDLRTALEDAVKKVKK